MFTKWENGNNRGFSLIELLIALSIFVIIASAFLLLYTKSFSDIFHSGHKNEALYEIQQELENTIYSNNNDGTDEIEINFPGLENSVKIKGKLERGDAQVGERSAEIIVFIPNRGEN